MEPSNEYKQYIDLEDFSNVPQFQAPKLSICSTEVSEITGRRSVVECIETISDTIETQKLVESVLKSRPPSPPPIVVLEAQQTCETCPCQDNADTCCRNKEICELPRLADFTPNSCKLNTQIQNAIPQKWESRMVQALRTIPESSSNGTSDPFTHIPQKHSSGALATALAIAPSVPFAAQPGLHMEPISLPEETVPYFPPEHPVIFESVEKTDGKKPEKVPENTSVGVRKKKTICDDFFKELPKPQQVLTFREALMTASDRPFSPFPGEDVDGNTTNVEEEKVERENLQTPVKPSVLPASFHRSSAQKPQAPKPFPVTVHTVHVEKAAEVDAIKYASTEKCEKVSTVEEAVQTSDDQSKAMYPLFKGFSCSFGNKTENTQFQIEISTTPPIINMEHFQTPEVHVTRAGESSEIITEESHVSEKSSCVTQQQRVEKQAEEIVYKKPLPLTSTLHKPEGLPQYQVNLSENLEADLQLMQKIEAAKSRHEQEKRVSNSGKSTPPQKPPREIRTKPVVVLPQGDADVRCRDQSFKPVCDDRPSSSTSSRPITPSMINKPAPTLPYYQASLVAQHYKAPEINLLDPASPSISRSPSPCPERRSVSPFRAAAAAQRPKSPAAGPPPNPLVSGRSLPSSRDFKIEDAKQSLSAYIPRHISKMESKAQRVCEAASQVQIASMCSEDVARSSVTCEQVGQNVVSTNRSEKLHLDHLMEMKKSECQSVEKSSDNMIEVHRKKTVTEEFEHSQKSTMIDIEKTVCGSKCGFKSVNNPVIEGQGIIGLHVTNPQPIVSPFLKPVVPQQQPKKPGQHVPPSFVPSVKPVPVASSSVQKPNRNINTSNIPVPNAGAGSGGGRQAGAVGVAPKRGRGILNAAVLGGTRVPLCASCHSHIRGPFITALGKIWCPDHFICATPSCRRPLHDLGFVEEQGQLYCEYCFEQYLAPPCSKCSAKIKGDCLKAIGKNFHPECFNCVYCGKLFGNSPFFLEDGNPYCEADWNELFTTKCFACGFPVEAGDRWVEALNNNYHSQCFNCTMCKKNLEGQSFFAKGGRPFCKNHAR